MFAYSSYIDGYGIKQYVIQYGDKKAWYSYDPSLTSLKKEAECELRAILGQELGLNGYYAGELLKENN